MEQNDLSKAGITNLFTSMMSEETKDRSSEEINLALEKLGSSINVYASTDAIIFSVQSLSKNLSKTMAILQERMLRPKFTEETFSRIKRQTIESIKNAKSQASAVLRPLL